MTGFRTFTLHAGRQAGRVLARIKRRVPFGVRTVLGLLLMVGGVFGMLPVLGFWMIPLGLLVIGLDVSALRARWRTWRARKADQRRKRSKDLR